MLPQVHTFSGYVVWWIERVPLWYRADGCSCTVAFSAWAVVRRVPSSSGAAHRVVHKNLPVTDCEAESRRINQHGMSSRIVLCACVGAEHESIEQGEREQQQQHRLNRDRLDGGEETKP